MKSLIYCLIFFTYSLSAQVDTLFTNRYFSGNDAKNLEWIKLNSQIYAKKLKSISIDHNLNKYILPNYFVLTFEIMSLNCVDTLCETGEITTDKIFIISESDNFDVLYCKIKDGNGLDRVLINEKEKLAQIYLEYEKLFTKKLKLNINDFLTSYFDKNTYPALNSNVHKVLKQISSKNNKNILVYLQNPIPEQKLYGILAVEIMKQKNITIPNNILKFYEIAKKTKGEVLICEMDVCFGTSFETGVNYLPNFAKKILELKKH